MKSDRTLMKVLINWESCARKLKSDVTYELVLADASATPVQRPKKTAPLLLRKRFKTIAGIYNYELNI